LARGLSLCVRRIKAEDFVENYLLNVRISQSLDGQNHNLILDAEKLSILNLINSLLFTWNARHPKIQFDHFEQLRQEQKQGALWDWQAT
jgi:hypothetical protein